MDFLRWLFEAQIPVGGSVLVLREVPGNIFGLASALGGMRRKVRAWSIGIAGNLLPLAVLQPITPKAEPVLPGALS